MFDLNLNCILTIEKEKLQYMVMLSQNLNIYTSILEVTYIYVHIHTSLKSNKIRK